MPIEACKGNFGATINVQTGLYESSDCVARLGFMLTPEDAYRRCPARIAAHEVNSDVANMRAPG